MPPRGPSAAPENGIPVGSVLFAGEGPLEAWVAKTGRHAASPAAGRRTG